MNESDELTELLFRIGARCNIEQYEMLNRCSEKKDITEWNEWRKANHAEEIWLSGADFEKVNLEGANLWDAHLEDAYMREAHLEDVKLLEAHLEGAFLQECHLEDANLFRAHLEGAFLQEAHLEDAFLWQAHLEGTGLLEAHLEGARLWGAHLEGVYFQHAHLEGANLRDTYLEGANLQDAYLKNVDFEKAITDGKTLIWNCDIDKDTNFTGVGLDSARVEPGLKQLLQYNIRRKLWQKWYKKHRLLKSLVWPFWQMSDYGRSTGRVIGTFFVLAFAFAGIYFAVPGLVDKLHVTGHWFGDLVRAVYFSIVTMTTLGFGDMYAHSQSIAGHFLLMFQVLLGYILLGALITRFAVLFTAGGPAGKFADKKKTHGGD